MHFFTKKSFLTLISKSSTPTDLHHPDLHLAQFFSLESLKIFSAYAKTSLGVKMEKILQTKIFNDRLNSSYLYSPLKTNVKWPQSLMNRSCLGGFDQSNYPTKQDKNKQTNKQNTFTHTLHPHPHKTTHPPHTKWKTAANIKQKDSRNQASETNKTY